VIRRNPLNFFGAEPHFMGLANVEIHSKKNPLEPRALWRRFLWVEGVRESKAIAVRVVKVVIFYKRVLRHARARFATINQ
jgi:hypothetical protein